MAKRTNNRNRSESTLIARLQKFFKTKIKSVRDATVNVELRPIVEDIKGAKPKDPAHCVYANCSTRSMGMHAAAVFSTKAYLQDKKGVVTRFEVPPSLRLEALSFDRGGKLPDLDSMIVYLKKPSASERLGRKKGRGPHEAKRSRVAQPSRHFAAEVRPRLW